MNILSLSNEVLYQVFDALECLDIIAARSTCWRLYLIGKIRLLWESKILQVSYASGIPVLESPMENYTSEELEEKLIKRARTRRKWHNLDSPVFDKTSFGEGFQCYKWLPGGRWLLAISGGRVNIIDLDSTMHNPSKRLWHLRSLGWHFLWSNIWIDPTKYWLSEARVAFYCHPVSPLNSIICVLQLVPTGRKLNMKWTTELYSAFKSRLRGNASGLHLEKEYVLATFKERMGTPFRAYLHKYSGGQHRYYKLDCDEESKISLLPEGRIAIVTPKHIEISVINPKGSHHLELQLVLYTLLYPMPGPYQDTLLEIRIPVDANKVYQKQITFTCGSLPQRWGPSLLARMPDEWSIEFISYELNASATAQVVSQCSTMHRSVFRKQPRLCAFDVTAGHVMIVEEGEYLLIRI